MSNTPDNQATAYRRFLVDLRTSPPRSPRLKLGPFILLARCLDKCRAHLAGVAGDYEFDSMIDRWLFVFKGISCDEFKAKVAEGLSDEEMLAWLLQAGIDRTEKEITAWSDDVLRYSLAYDPTGDLHRTPKRVEYLTAACVKYGLEPLTTPVLERLEVDDLRSFGQKQNLEARPPSDPQVPPPLHFDPENDNHVSALDELSLWSAPFGLKLLDAVELGRGLHVLDVGFGTGFPMLELAARLDSSSEIYGLDPWIAAHRRAQFKLQRSGLANVQLHVGRAEQMPFADGFFDRVVSNNGYNNVADMSRAFQETARVCRRGAQLVFTMNLDDSFREFHDAFRAVLEKEALPAAICALGELIRAKRKPLGEVLSLVRAAGFRIERVEHDQFAYRFSDGATLLNHPFFRFFQVSHWQELVLPLRRDVIFSETTRRLNAQAEQLGELRLSVPFVTVSGRLETPIGE